MPRYNRHRLSHRQARHALDRLLALRAAGVPIMVTAHAAYYLSGGVRGTRGDHEAMIPTAAIARDVPDCLSFLPDYDEHA